MLKWMMIGCALAATMAAAGISAPSLAASTADIRQIKFTGFGQSTWGNIDSPPAEIGAPVQVSGLWILKEGIPRVGLYDIFASSDEQSVINGNAESYLFRLFGSPLFQANNISSETSGDGTTRVHARIMDGEVVRFAALGSGYNCGRLEFFWLKGSLGQVNQENFAGCGNDWFSDRSWSASISRVSVNTFIPEPATWAMLIVGFGAVGVAARRRRQDTAMA